MVKRAASPIAKVSLSKKAKSVVKFEASDVLGEGRWIDWPAPAEQLQNAREFFKEWSVRSMF